MNHPDFRQLLNSLSYSAWECWRVLNSGPGGPTEDKVDEEFSHFLSDEGQIGDGEGQIGEDEIKESIRSRLRLDRNRKEDALFTGMGCKMDEALSFFQNRWLAGVADSKAINDLWDLLRLIEKRAIIGIKEFGRRSATIDDLERIRELVAVLLGGEPIEAKEPRSSWQCPNGKIKVPNRLKEPLEAYLAGLPDYDLKDHHQPRKVKTDLKKLIQKACDAGYQPDPDRWPRSEGQDGGGMMLYFDAQEDGNRRNQGKRKKA